MCVCTYASVTLRNVNLGACSEHQFTLTLRNSDITDMCIIQGRQWKMSMKDVNGGGGGVVLCPPRVCLPARNGLVNEVEFLGLIPQNGGRPMRLRDH